VARPKGRQLEGLAIWPLAWLLHQLLRTGGDTADIDANLSGSNDPRRPGCGGDGFNCDNGPDEN